jgi:predicted aconitase with swiveling domain
VEKEVITETDFRDFVFANPVSFFGGMNPEFFTGTVVEEQAKKLRNGGAHSKSCNANC